MKFLLDRLEKDAHLFEKGGKFEKLYPLWEAQDTFLFTPPDVTKGTTHIRDGIDLKRVMITVVLALIPCLLFGIYNAGNNYNLINEGHTPGLLSNMWFGSLIVLPIIITSYVVGGLCEVMFSIVRKHEINEGFLVTGMLFPLTLAPTTPLWLVALGIAFGVIIGKEIFGGTGFNILNPALTARAFIFFAYPAYIVGDKVWAVSDVDGWTGATPLGLAMTADKDGQAMLAAGSTPRETILGLFGGGGHDFSSMFIGLEYGSIGETSVVAVLIGLIILLVTGIASWRIMLGGALGLAATAALMNMFSTPDLTPAMAIPWHYHFVLGSFMFGIVFMATDPVSAAATDKGKWIYGFLIGAITVIIRVANPAYPEGVMLAILFMNVMAPLIDHFVVESHIKQRNATIRNF